MELRTKNHILISVAAVLLLCAATAWGEKAPQKIFDMAANELAAYGKDPVIVEAVKVQNVKNMSIEDIKKNG